MADLATVVARFTEALRASGHAPGADRAAAFARSLLLVRPRTVAELRYCAHATLAVDIGDLAQIDALLVQVSSKVETVELPGDLGALASESERLRHRDFGELTADELAQLAAAMRRLRLAPPPRRSRRQTRSPHGRRLDLRSTLRGAQRTGGDPVRLERKRRREKPRRLVLLCDISGSMEPYARAMLQLVYCASVKAEVFSFATRLTRLTPTMRSASPASMLDRAGLAAPDWSGGTRIGLCLREFIDQFGRGGMARGAVIVIVSDGWETGAAALLGEQMQRLSRLAHRIVWANPRTQSPHFRPLVGGMATALPFCDAVVSGHSLAALDELIAAIAG